MKVFVIDTAPQITNDLENHFANDLTKITSANALPRITEPSVCYVPFRSLHPAYDVVAELNGIKKQKQLLVVVATEEHDDNEELIAYHHGADVYIAFPLPIHHINQIIPTRLLLKQRTRTAKGKRVLIIEDDISDQAVYRLALGELEQDFATNLIDARVLLQGQNFDLIIIDVMLEDGEGFDLIPDIKSSDNNRQCAFVFATSKNRTADIGRGFSQGAIDYMTKPLLPELVQAKVNYWFKLI